MSRISKKQTKVKRSRAAKKGWATRRRNQRKVTLAQKQAQYQAKMKELDEKLADAKKRSTVQLADLEKTTSFKIIAQQAALGMVTLKEALAEIPDSDREAAIKHIIQARLDRAQRLFGDVRVEAWDLAEELDWDITDVYDGWDYEEGSAA